MFGRLFELLDCFVEKWLSRRAKNDSRQYEQLRIDWHTLEATGMGEDE